MHGRIGQSHLSLVLGSQMSRKSSALIFLSPSAAAPSIVCLSVCLSSKCQRIHGRIDDFTLRGFWNVAVVVVAAVAVDLASVTGQGRPALRLLVPYL